MRNVIVTTKHRGVFYGQTDAQDGSDPVVLRDAKMAIRWGTTRGILQLAHTGPTPTSKISLPCPRLDLRDITAIIDVTEEAASGWAKA